MLFFSTNVAGGGDPGSDTVGHWLRLVRFLRHTCFAVGDTSLKFIVGIDVNRHQQSQTLESFCLLNLTTHTVLAAFSPEPGGLRDQLQTMAPDFLTTRSPVSTSISALIFTLAINSSSLHACLVQTMVLIASSSSAQGVRKLRCQRQCGCLAACLGLAGMVAGHRRRKSRSVWDEQRHNGATCLDLALGVYCATSTEGSNSQ